MDGTSGRNRGRVRTGPLFARVQTIARGSRALSEENRKHKRVPTDFLIRARVSTHDEVQEGICQNLSTGGLFIQMQEPLPKGTELYLELKLEPINQTIHAEGVVVWVRPSMPDPKFPSGIGMRFTAISDEALQLVESVVDGLPEK